MSLLHNCCMGWRKKTHFFMTVFEFYRNIRVQLKLDCVLPSLWSLKIQKPYLSCDHHSYKIWIIPLYLWVDPKGCTPNKVIQQFVNNKFIITDSVNINISFYIWEWVEKFNWFSVIRMIISNKISEVLQKETMYWAVNSPLDLSWISTLYLNSSLVPTL